MFPLGGSGLPGFPFQSPFPVPAPPPGAFQRNLRAYPVSFIDKPQLENGDKIILPPSALDALTQMQVSYPMLFQLESSAGRITHCGVMEFIAEEGFAYLPYWMMQNIAVSEGELIKVIEIYVGVGERDRNSLFCVLYMYRLETPIYPKERLSNFVHKVRSF
jgi:hypothetical protein